jgi:hypothetical protein
MPAKLLICCAGRPALNGSKRRSFLWSEPNQCYVYEGRELGETEFNAKSKEVMSKNQDLRCFVKIVSEGGGASEDPRIAQLEAKLAEKQARLETVQASLIEARTKAEPSLEDAIAIVERLAPDRLKKKPGRKPEPAAT